MAKFAGAVTAAQGFQAAGVHAGIKTSNHTKKDVAMIYSTVPCVVAGVFTTNVVKAAPVRYDMEIVKKGVARAIVVNSGNANACTGQQGMDDVKETAEYAGGLMGINSDEVLVCSTGVIGHTLPMDRIKEGIASAHSALSDSPEGGHDAAQAILTTDVYLKEISYTIDLDGVPVTIGGIAKGSGMICPNMATMLAFITTDASIEGNVLKKLMKEAADLSFNQISVDGDMSTNDTMLMMANGLAGNAKIEEGTKNYDLFKEALLKITAYLAKKIARDGEGATHLFEAEVINAPDEKSARKIAKSIVSSNLVKAAIFGKDANWGRIICAAGYAGVDFDPSLVDIYLKSANGSILVAQNGGGLEFNEEEALDILKEENVFAVVDLKSGNASGKAWGCDLTYDYVKINADYRT
ncbi:MAG TPA: bifunctional ornithine acetyltransferase/N-acetylglutamate synthase [Firmicutes bacterium]|nr:bifunctional ornithine acetyltransferase/N-acetylglutamate synthase [Bacillota bacterium]